MFTRGQVLRMFSLKKNEDATPSTEQRQLVNAPGGAKTGRHAADGGYASDI